jgi:fluoride exporter
MSDLLFVFIGGGIGAGCRWLVSRAAARLFGDAFPWGTHIVNLFGCFCIGLALGLVEHGFGSRRFKPLAVAGFLGGLTTFSTFAYETIELLRHGYYAKAVANFSLDAFGGLALAGLGLVLGLYIGERSH